MFVIRLRYCLKVVLLLIFLMIVVHILVILFKKSDSHVGKNKERFFAEKLRTNIKTKRELHTARVSVNNKLHKFFKEYKINLDKKMDTNDLPGEMGRPVTSNPKDLYLAKQAIDTYGVNTFVSEKISLERSLPDYRHKLCQNMTYPRHHLTASCVLIFRDEALSLVLRSVHSIVNRSPPNMLKEVILVDDASTKDELGEPLDDYVGKTWPPGLVKLLRLKSRQGLMRARNEGAGIARGDVLVMLDAHVEVTKDWLEPLLDRIRLNPKELAIPVTPMISPVTFEYIKIPDNIVEFTTFLWNLDFMWQIIPSDADEGVSPIDPIRAPVMIGCAFAISRKFFFKIGAFDDGMEVWGGENIDLPIRVWLCGGKVHIIPCSQVGHVYRSKTAWKWDTNFENVIGKNLVRFAEVWLDDYKDLFYFYRPDLKNIDAGNLTERLLIKKHLQCKNFKWYIRNVAVYKFVPTEHSFAYGQVSNGATESCIDIDGSDATFENRSLLIRPCIKTTSKFFQYQIFSWSKKYEIRRELDCLGDTDKLIVSIEKCVLLNQTPPIHQQWDYNEKTGEIINRKTKRCLDISRKMASTRNMLTVSQCSNISQQRWKFQYYLKR